MRVARQGQTRIGVASDRLHERDVGAGGDQARDAGVAAVVEPVGGPEDVMRVPLAELGALEGGRPDPAGEVGAV